MAQLKRCLQIFFRTFRLQPDVSPSHQKSFSSEFQLKSLNCSTVPDQV
ncbi:hypothetical protein MY7_3363 [Bacillus sp. 5B6]|nr:hypothetical protein MY7_3363 [Bacillus sp. 5B6]